MNMDLKILLSNPELAKAITLQINGADLSSFANKLKTETAQEVEKKLQEASKPETYLTRQEAANVLSASLTTLWHWDNKGILIPLRIGSKVRYRRSDIDTALAKNDK